MDSNSDVNLEIILGEKTGFFLPIGPPLAEWAKKEKLSVLSVPLW